jgi:hypothetical protein
MPENIQIHAFNFGELKTEVLRKLWIDPSEDSNGFPTPTSFVKYSEYRIKKKINQAYSEIMALTRSLKSWFIIPLMANYSQYPVPISCFDISKVYYFSSATAYTELPVYNEDFIEEELSEGWRTTTSTPEFAFVADRNKMVVKLGVAPAPSTSATTITLASTLSQKAQPYGTIEAVIGSAAPGSATNKYVDAGGQDFSDLGVIVGLVLLNTTDGSRGTITSITTTNTSNDSLTCSAGLSGGLNNIWTPGDEMRIIGGEYGGTIEIGDTEAEYILAPNAGQLPSPSITMAANNLLVQGFMYPILLINNHQYPELAPPFHYYIALRAAGLLGQEESSDSPEFTKAQDYMAESDQALSALASFSATQYKHGYQLWSVRT